MKGTKNIHKLIFKITFSAMCIALYVVVMYLTQSFAFGAYQIRIATSIYCLGYFFPFLIIPMGIANALSNIIGGLGFLDIFGGAIAGIVTTALCALIGKIKFKNSCLLVALPITFVPGLLVPIWLAPVLKIPYILLALNLVIGQAFCGVFGAVLTCFLKKYKI